MPAACLHCCQPSAAPSRVTCSATDLPLAPTFAYVGCRAPHIDERKLGRRPQPRKLPTVRDRWGNGSAPSREGSDRRLDGFYDGLTPRRVDDLAIGRSRPSGEVPQIEGV